MSDSMWIQGKEYISSKRASELSGYAQDYVGQLARKGLVDAQRVGGLWFISQASLTKYKSHADAYIPQLPEKKESQDVDSLISFDGKDHISASRAAKITGYHPDYVGQLARSGTIISRQVGNRWYVDREGILTHKQEKDRLLGAVQAQSVGIARGNVSASEDIAHTRYDGPGPLLTYTSDTRELLPTLLNKSDPAIPADEQRDGYPRQESDQEYPVAIRRIRTPEHLPGTHPHPLKRPQAPKRPSYYRTYKSLATAALTIVIVLSFGFVTLKNSSVYSGNTGPDRAATHKNMLAAGASAAIEWIDRFARNFLVKDIVYKRPR